MFYKGPIVSSRLCTVNKILSTCSTDCSVQPKVTLTASSSMASCHEARVTQTQELKLHAVWVGFLHAESIGY